MDKDKHQYADDDDENRMHTSFREVLPWLKMISRALPLLAILTVTAYLLSQRSNYFPESGANNNPPNTQSIGGFELQQPAIDLSDGKTADTSNNTTRTTTARTSPDTPTRTTTSGTATPPRSTDSTTASSTNISRTTTQTPTTDRRTSSNPTPPPTKIDWSKTQITKPIPGAYVAIFLSRKAVTLVVDKQYARIYYYASIPATAQPGNYTILDHKLRKGVMTLILDYPTTQQAAAALRAGKISQRQYNAISAAHTQKRQPPYNTPLGGPLAIRGDGGKNTPAKGMDFGITPQQMAELWLAVRTGTPVRIVK